MFGKARLEYNELRIRDYINVLYIIISIAFFYSNKIEEKLILEEGKHNPEISHNIRLVVFGVLVMIYIYFVYEAYTHYKENPEDNNAILELFASTLFLIAGIIFLYLESQQVVNEDVEDGGAVGEGAGVEV